MFSVRTDSIPTLFDYVGARKYIQDTAPIKTGGNKGVIPLRTTRRDPDTYNIRVDRDRHPLNDELQFVVCCRYHNTDIVKFYEDGVVEIDNHCSISTAKIQSELMGWCDFSGNGSNKELYIKARHLIETPLYAPFCTGYGCHYRIPFGDENMFLIPSINSNGAKLYSVYGHGYYVGNQRAFHNKTAGAFIRQAQAQLRALYRMRGCNDESSREERTLADMFEGKTQRWTRLKEAHVNLFEIINRFGWKRGDTISADAMNEILAVVPEAAYFSSDDFRTYNDRLCHWESLRLAIRYADERAYNFSDWRIYTEEEAFKLTTDIEEVESW